MIVDNGRKNPRKSTTLDRHQVGILFNGTLQRRRIQLLQETYWTACRRTIANNSNYHVRQRRFGANRNMVGPAGEIEGR